MGYIEELIRRKMARYENRDPSTIYIHMLDGTVWAAMAKGRQREPPNGYMIIGELIHAGIEALLEPASEKCVEVDVEPGGIPDPVFKRFVNNMKARVCGSADAYIKELGAYVELKTTVRSPENRPLSVWKRRARHYAALYEAPVLLVIVDRATGQIQEELIPDPGGRVWLAKRVNEWLRGEYPFRAF